jgi:hypothetical protein
VAIKFARVEHLSRNKGGSLIRAAAYQMCGVMVSERTGQRFPRREPHYGDPATLRHHEIRLPAGALEAFRKPSVLWNAYDLIETRKNAALGRWMVVPLPNQAEISLADCIDMVQGWVDRHFVSKGIPAQIDIHDADNNRHAHVLVPTRRLGPDGISPRKALDLDPQVRTIGGRRIVVAADVWGDLWGAYQNEWFEQHGKSLRVDQRLEYTTEHLGPRRHQHPLDPRVQRAAQLRLLNAQQQVMVDRVQVRGRGKRDRPLKVEDVARELSAAYAKQLAIIDRLNNPNPKPGELSIPKAVAMRRYNRYYRDMAAANEEDRRRSIGPIRRAFDRIGRVVQHSRRRDDRIIVEALLDNDMRKWGTETRISEYSVDRWGIKVGAMRGELAQAERLAAEAFEKVRPEAEAELAQRQRIARRARDVVRQAQGPQQPAQRQSMRRGQRP